MEKICELPRKIIAEKGAINRVGEIAPGFGSKFMVVADQTTKSFGASEIAKSLSCDLFIIKDNSMEEVKRAEAGSADCIISFGGGRVIDIGKMAAHNKKIPFISVPTACSHDGIVSGNASIAIDNISTSISSTTPSAVIADIDILSKAPYKLTASGAAEVLCKFASVADWKIASDRGQEQYSEPIAALTLSAANTVLNSIEKIKRLEEDGIKDLFWSLMITSFSMSFFGSSRPASGAEHMFSHSLDKIGRFGLHGEQVGLGSIFFSCLQGEDWEKIKLALEKVGAPVKAQQIGVSQEIFIEAMIKAKDIRKRYTIMDEKPLNRELILKVGKKTGII